MNVVSVAWKIVGLHYFQKDKMILIMTSARKMQYKNELLMHKCITDNNHLTVHLKTFWNSSLMLNNLTVSWALLHRKYAGCCEVCSIIITKLYANHIRIYPARTHKLASPASRSDIFRFPFVVKVKGRLSLCTCNTRGRATTHCGSLVRLWHMAAYINLNIHSKFKHCPELSGNYFFIYTVAFV